MSKQQNPLFYKVVIKRNERSRFVITISGYSQYGCKDIILSESFEYSSKKYAIKKAKEYFSNVQDKNYCVVDGQIYFENELISYMGKFYPDGNGGLLHEDEIDLSTGSVVISQSANACVDDCEITPPPSNTGGLEKNFRGDFERDLSDLVVSESYIHNLVMDNGKVREILLRRGFETPAFIDTLSIVFSRNVSLHYIDKSLDYPSDEELVKFILEDINKIMGFGATNVKINGRNGYEKAIQIGRDLRNFGYIAFGGHNQKGTVMVHFTGEGLANASIFWEKNLYLFLNDFPDGLVKITRIDLSHDCLFGEYNVEQVIEDWDKDLYTVRAIKPQLERNGSDWDSKNGKGRTVYIGSKKSSKLLMFYEKGKQLGDNNSKWLRCELRVRSKDFIIPLSVLLYPGDYFCNAYPHLSKVLNYESTQDRFDRVKKQNEIGLLEAIKYVRYQASPVIKALKKLGYDDCEIINKIYDSTARISKRLVGLYGFDDGDY